MRSPYKENCPQGLELIGHQLIEHCLPFFIDPNCPRVSISDSNAQIDLNAWPLLYARMAFVHLKNAGITDNERLAFDKTETARLTSERIRPGLFRQVHHIGFTLSEFEPGKLLVEALRSPARSR